jgi:hypothetical protein
MTGAVALAAVVGLAGLLTGIALGWYLRRTNDWCPHCGDQLSCGACGQRGALTGDPFPEPVGAGHPGWR